MQSRLLISLALPSSRRAVFPRRAPTVWRSFQLGVATFPVLRELGWHPCIPAVVEPFAGARGFSTRRGGVGGGALKKNIEVNKRIAQCATASQVLLEVGRAFDSGIVLNEVVIGTSFHRIAKQSKKRRLSRDEMRGKTFAQLCKEAKSKAM